MSSSGKFAPSSLPRHERRRIDRQLSKLIERDACSLCGNAFKHNSRTASGLDQNGNVALAGECCSDRLAEIFTLGLYSNRTYDFLLPRGGAPAGEPGTAHQIAGAIAGYQKAIAETDKRLDGIEQRGGSIARCNVFTRDTPEKRDDRAWFERNPQRAHRVRMPFPGEAGDAAEKTPAGHAMIILVRQIEPGSRLRHSFYLNADLLPVPDDEAVAHALLEVAVGNEPVPPDGAACLALIRKYAVGSQSS